MRKNWLQFASNQEELACVKAQHEAVCFEKEGHKETLASYEGVLRSMRDASRALEEKHEVLQTAHLLAQRREVIVTAERDLANSENSALCASVQQSAAMLQETHDSKSQLAQQFTSCHQELVLAMASWSTIVSESESAHMRIADLEGALKAEQEAAAQKADWCAAEMAAREAELQDIRVALLGRSSRQRWTVWPLRILLHMLLLAAWAFLEDAAGLVPEAKGLFGKLRTIPGEEEKEVARNAESSTVQSQPPIELNLGDLFVKSALDTAVEQPSLDDQKAASEIGDSFWITPRRASQFVASQKMTGLISIMQGFQDRRFPAPAWDFSCWERKLEGLMQATADFNGKRKASSDFKGVRQVVCHGVPSLPVDQLAALVHKPRFPLGVQQLATLGPPTRPTSKEPSVINCLAQRPVSRTTAVSALLERIRKDAQMLADQAGAMDVQFLHISPQSINGMLGRSSASSKVDTLQEKTDKLIKYLEGMLQSDNEALRQAVGTASDLANGQGCESLLGKLEEKERRQRAILWLGQFSGCEAVLGFKDVLWAPLVENGVEAVLAHMNPLLKGRQAESMGLACTVALLVATRTVMCNRCIVQLIRLRGLLVHLWINTSTKVSMRSLTGRWVTNVFNRETYSRSTTANKQDRDKAAARCAVAAAAEQVARDSTVQQHCVTSGT